MLIGESDQEVECADQESRMRGQDTSDSQVNTITRQVSNAWCVFTSVCVTEV
jgi:hypothetical protein